MALGEHKAGRRIGLELVDLATFRCLPSDFVVGAEGAPETYAAASAPHAGSATKFSLFWKRVPFLLTFGWGAPR